VKPAYADSLWAGWQAAGGAPGVAVKAALVDRLDQLQAALGFEASGEALGRLLGAKLQGVELGAARLEELCLVAGCLEGLRPALDAFDQRMLRPVVAAMNDRLLRGLGRDELAQQIREKLLVPVNGTLRLQGWGGRSPLVAWVRAVATRLALDARDAHGKEALEDEQTEALIARLPAEGNPELSALQASHKSQLTTALRQAVRRLPRRERTVLRLHVFQGLSTEQLGRVFHADGSTVRRWIQGARETVLEGVRQALRERFELSVSQVDSVVRGVDGGITLSLSALNSLQEP
jgi:RNA polymerase sigma-70 factor (ECF subfamily)